MFQRIIRNRSQINKFCRLYSATPNAVEDSESNIDKLYKVVELELKGNDPAVLKSFAEFATLSANQLNIETKT